jgi:hypothetical protein
MDSLYSVPTPKTPTKQCSRDDRLRVQTLYFEASFTQDQVVLQTGLTRSQVQYCLAHRLTPQRFFFNTPQRKRLIEWVCSSQKNRRTRWADTPPILEWDCGEKAIRAAFKREGFVRRIDRRKPPLTAEYKRDRLT